MKNWSYKFDCLKYIKVHELSGSVNDRSLETVA